MPPPPAPPGPSSSFVPNTQAPVLLLADASDTNGILGYHLNECAVTGLSRDNCPADQHPTIFVTLESEKVFALSFGKRKLHVRRDKDGKVEKIAAPQVVNKTLVVGQSYQDILGKKSPIKKIIFTRGTQPLDGMTIQDVFVLPERLR